MTGGYQIFHREERLNDVNVTGVRMGRDPVSDLRRYANGYFQIGKTLETLGDTAGRLEAYFEDELSREKANWRRKHLPLPTLKEILDTWWFGFYNKEHPRTALSGRIASRTCLYRLSANLPYKPELPPQQISVCLR